MIVALLALAAALMVAPARPRLAAVERPRPRRAWLAVGVAAAAAGTAVVAPVSVVAAVGVVGATVVLRRHRSLARSCTAAESSALQGALDVLAGELRAGAHPVVAFETAAAETRGDVAASLRGVAARARLGVDVAAGIRSAAESSATADQWRRLAACWELAHRHGLAIAVLVRTAHREFVERDRFESQFAAAMAGARTTALVLAGLPVLGIGLGQLIGANPLRFLTSGGLGGILLVVGVVLACAGLLWSDRITRPT